MSTVNYKNISFDVSDALKDPSFFVLGVRKSGSSLLNKIVRALARRQAIPFVDIPDTLFRAGMSVSDWQHDTALISVVTGGNVFGGFRNAPLSLFGAPAFIASRKVLLVRDPRDALVSEYFSNAYSHGLPEEGTGRELFLEKRRAALDASIVAYVIKEAPAMAMTLMQFEPLLQDPMLRIYKYEDVISQKRTWLNEISGHFGWSIDEKHFDAILRNNDVLPNTERPTEFIRRVTPGDHREKLSADAIAELDKILSEPMRLFGYL